MLAPHTSAKDEPLHLEGSSATIQAPPSSWAHTKHDEQAGQIGCTWTYKGSGAVVSVLVFPVRREGTAKALLRQAVDTAVRGRTRSGFGMLDQKSFQILGRDGSDARIEIALAKEKALGHARLLRIADAQWAFAWGYAPEKAPADVAGLIKRVVTSLQTTDPALFTLRFDERPTFSREVVTVKGEEAIRREHIIALQLLLEASRGERYPVAVRPLLRKALVDDARRSKSKWRDGFREALRSVRKAEHQPLDVRRKLFTEWGTAIFAGYVLRSVRRELAGMKVTTIWEKLSAPVATHKGESLKTCDYSALAEMASFFASLGLDKGVPVSDEIQASLKKSLAKRWTSLCDRAGFPDSPAKNKQAEPKKDDADSQSKDADDPSKRNESPKKDESPALTDDQKAARAEVERLQHADRQWATLRYAWDRAAPEARLAFRKALVKRVFADSEEKSKAIDALKNRAALKRWFEAQDAEQAPSADDIVRRMMEMTGEEREGLIEMLGVGDADDLRFGW